ncbi:MAG: hypothetical protein M1830_007400 [Pleopsidium flavum]|nr:MAG: hypothetical protein M1830_007400 [Pleopsidium flavum]
MTAGSKRQQSRRSSGVQRSATHRSTLSLQKTEILINVYDLLPPGKLSSMLWILGGSLLHSGVVINEKEYAYGGHDRPGMSGVYWTRPRMEPPGGTFRCELLHGFTIRPEKEIENIIKETSQEFQGTAYNLLSNNCNHFTSYLCEKLTSRSAPAWLNRAASIGVALPCVVPREWIEPPDHDTAEGELLEEEEEEEDEDESVSMLRQDTRRVHSFHDSSRDVDDGGWDSDRDRRNGGRGKGKGPVRDTDGRVLPTSERAP